jgi:hypothetical protein
MAIVSSTWHDERDHLSAAAEIKDCVDLLLSTGRSAHNDYRNSCLQPYKVVPGTAAVRCRTQSGLPEFIKQIKDDVDPIRGLHSDHQKPLII